MLYYKIAVKRALLHPLTYRSRGRLQAGQKALVPLGKKNRPVSGLVLGEDPEKGAFAASVPQIKTILKTDGALPPIDPARLQWLQWMSRYFHYPIGLLADLMFPPLPFKFEENRQRTAKDKASLKAAALKEESQATGGHALIAGNLLKTPRSFFKAPLSGGRALASPSDISLTEKPSEGGASPPDRKDPLSKPPLILTADQKRCADEILSRPGFQPHLLFGVTGSGKTEVYKQAVERVLQEGKQALVLLPEIFLTTQIVRRFADSFPGKTAVFHSQISPRQKTKAWQDLVFQKKSLLTGTRSALFCPLPRLGLIVADEEHDPSFKQDVRCRYHARDCALMLAKLLKIPIVLGSATPSLSSLYQAKRGKYRFHKLKTRPGGRTLPKVKVADLREEARPGLKSPARPFWLSRPLHFHIEKALSRGRQAALFLNRRGRASALLCLSCGHAEKCLNCDISLTLHGEERLICHYCSYFQKKPSLCPSCGKGDAWLERGLGTEAVEEALSKLFPSARIIRADRDAIDSQKEMEAFIGIVERREADIIIGTQMIAKGLDFPSIEVAGLLLADSGFHFPDFRASERTVQLLMQMAGRAGRKQAGQVVLQTFQPERAAVLFAKKHDYLSFAKEELKSRKKFFYPPFSRLALFHINSLKEEAGRAFASDLGRLSRGKARPGMQILGPSPAPLFKIQNRWRFQILVKAASASMLQDFLDEISASVRKRRFVNFVIDRDPMSMQ